MHLKVSSAKWCPLCLGFNILSNLNSRVDPGNIVQYDFLVNALNKEVVDNWQFYVPFINGSSVDRLFVGMNAYVYHKKYDTPSETWFFVLLPMDLKLQL